MHQNQRGITIITLVITIVIVIIIASVSITVGVSVYNNAKLTAFVSEMNIIQEQVNTAHTKIKNGDTQIQEQGQRIADLDEEKRQKIETILDGKDSNNYRYFDQSALKQIGIDGTKQTVIINFTTREVYSLTGIEYKGKMYYTQYDLPGGQYNIGFDVSTGSNPEFNLEKKNYGTYTTINVNDIVYNTNISGGTLYYALVQDEETEPDYWQKISGTSITVNKSGKYAIKLVDKANNQAIRYANVIIANAPKLADGMIPIVYENNKWKIVSSTSGDWYDYADKKWANVMLSDGTYGIKDGQLANTGQIIEDNELGSMFVWIPRYAYCITNGYKQSSGGNINVKFLKSTTNLATDEANIRIVNTSGLNNWNVPSAFTDGSKNNYENGGWNEELEGIWVAKFEASSSSPTSTNGGGDVTNLNVKVLPGVTSWRGISLQNIFQNCKNMNTEGNIYALPLESLPHQMKNIEWGAVAYLTQSEFGKNSEPYINNSTTYITGNSANGVDAVGTDGVVNSYKTDTGQKASTTGNIYGIYDLNGGALERMAGYVKTGSAYIATNAENMLEAEKYYYDEYENGYSNNSTRYGDAICETSSSGTGATSWNTDLSVFPTADMPFISRGGWSNNGINAGIYAFYDDTSGTASSNYGFRPVIVV